MKRVQLTHKNRVKCAAIARVLSNSSPQSRAHIQAFLLVLHRQLTYGND